VVVKKDSDATDASDATASASITEID